MIDGLRAIFGQNGDIVIGRFATSVIPAKRIAAESLARIIDNLVRNAMEHPRDDVRMKVMIGISGNRLILNDNGSGMTAAVREGLLRKQRYHDGEPVSSEDHRGFGWIKIQELAETLGIGIRIESTPGKGTTVFLELPRNFWDVDQNKFEIDLRYPTSEDWDFILTLTPQGKLFAVGNALIAVDSWHKRFVSDLESYIEAIKHNDEKIAASSEALRVMDAATAQGAREAFSTRSARSFHNAIIRDKCEQNRTLFSDLMARWSEIQKMNDCIRRAFAIDDSESREGQDMAQILATIDQKLSAIINVMAAIRESVEPGGNIAQVPLVGQLLEGRIIR